MKLERTTITLESREESEILLAALLEFRNEHYPESAEESAEERILSETISALRIIYKFNEIQETFEKKLSEKYKSLNTAVMDWKTLYEKELTVEDGEDV